MGFSLFSATAESRGFTRSYSCQICNALFTEVDVLHTEGSWEAVPVINFSSAVFRVQGLMTNNQNNCRAEN